MAIHETILVGTDGSASATAAVRWAAVEADRRGAALRIVHAFDESWATVPARPGLGLVETAHDGAAVMTTDARLTANATAPGVSVRADTVVGDAPTALLAAAVSADLVVLGNRGRGGFTSLVLGSTSLRVAAHAPCPVAVVRGRTMALDGPVVVGSDGSHGGESTLRTGFEAAAARHTGLLVVRAFQLPALPATPGMPVVAASERECETGERNAVAALLAPWRDKFPTVRVDTLVSCGDAGRVLVGTSHTAQLLVVGSRGLGTFVGTVLGSVTTQLLHHADCPVLIAR